MANAAYRSPYGPKYTINPNVAGWTIKSGMNLGMTLAAFGVSAGVFAIFFASGIPRVKKDILQKAPIVGEFYEDKKVASDNPF